MWWRIVLDTTEALNLFLAGVETRAYRIAEFSVGDPDEALDLVQDAMFGFVRRYSDRPENEWGALFFKILQNKITDWYRRTAVRNRFRTWFGKSGEDTDDREDPIQMLPDSNSPDPVRSLINSHAAEALKATILTLPLAAAAGFSVAGLGRDGCGADGICNGMFHRKRQNPLFAGSTPPAYIA